MSKSQPLVSVIIVNFNGQKWLKKCLDSLLDQTYNNFEIIFVDNNSSDDSIEFLEKNYQDKRIKIIKNEKNLGFAGGNNVGIKEAKGDYILFLNNDTWVGEGFLENLWQQYRNLNIDVLGPDECSYDGSQDQDMSMVIDILGHPMWLYKKYNKSFYLSGFCLFFSKDLYLNTKGLDNNFFMYFEETDWFWRLNLLGKKFKKVSDIKVYHAGSGSTGSGIKYLSFLWRNQNTLQMLLKNYSAITLIFILPIYILQNIIEMIFFLVILKPKISLSYLQGWYFNIKYLRRTLAERKWVQNNRRINDLEVMKKMYIGSAKFKHLLEFFKL